MTRMGRVLLVVVVVAMVLLIVAMSDGDYRHFARHFLGNLIRQLF